MASARAIIKAPHSKRGANGIRQRMMPRDQFLENARIRQRKRAQPRRCYRRRAGGRAVEISDEVAVEESCERPPRHQRSARSRLQNDRMILADEATVFLRKAAWQGGRHEAPALGATARPLDNDAVSLNYSSPVSSAKQDVAGALLP